MAILGGSLVIVAIFTVAYGTFRLREHIGKKRKMVGPIDGAQDSPSVIELISYPN